MVPLISYPRPIGKPEKGILIPQSKFKAIFKSKQSFHNCISMFIFHIKEYFFTNVVMLQNLDP